MKKVIKITILPILMLLLISNSLNISWAYYSQEDWDNSLKKTLYINEQFDISELAYNTVGIEEVKWFSSNPDVATVNIAGVVTAKGSGRTLIQAYPNDGSSLPHFSLGLTVYNGIRSLELAAPKQDLFIGEKLQLSWIVDEYKASDLTHKNVKFKSSRPKILTVNSKGEIQARSEGTAFISIKTNNYEAHDLLKFTVHGMVKKVSIEEVPEIVSVGEKIEAKAFIFPRDALEKSVTWKSSSNAKVSSSGVITPLKEGDAYISVTTKDGGKKDTVKIKINSLVRSVQLSENQISLRVGESSQLSAKVIPKIKGKEPVLAGVTWKSNYSDIVSVSSNGKIHAKKPGTARITATSKDGEKEATCTVQVSGGRKSKVQASFDAEAKKLRTVYTNEQVTLPYTIVRADDDKSYPKVTIYGNEYKKSIHENTIDFTALEVGNYAIVLGEDNKTSSISLSARSHIKSIKIHTDELQKYSGYRYRFYTGQKGQLYGSCEPNEDKYLETLKWTSSDSSIINIDKFGNYTANKPGYAHIELYPSDKSHTSRIYVEVVGLAESVNTARRVKMGPFIEYEPEVDFVIPKNLQNEFEGVVNQKYTLHINKLYVDKSYLENELAYEKSRKKEWRTYKKEGYDKKNNLKPPIDKCNKRITALKSFIKNDEYSDNWCLIDEPKKLWNRNFAQIHPIKISGQKVTGTMPCSAEIELVSKDGNKTTTFEVTIDESLQDEIMIRQNGKWEHIYSKSTKKERTLRTPNDDTKNKMQTLSDKAKFYKFDLPSLAAQQKRDITRREMSAICINILKHTNKETIPSIKTNLFTDTDLEIANQAFQLGLVGTNLERKFYPNKIVSRQEMADMLYKTVLLSEKNLKREHFYLNKYSDINSIDDNYMPAFTSLALQNSYVKSESKNYIMPTQKVSIEEAVQSAIRILENLK